MDNPIPSDPSQRVQPATGSHSGQAQCAVHLNVAASFRCDECGRTLCNICGFQERNGKIVCTECDAPRRLSRGALVPELDIGPIDPELAQKMAEKSDLELLDMFESPDDWRPESLDAARAELKKRKLREPLNGKALPIDKNRFEAVSNPRPSLSKKCSWCGRENVGETEHCPKCGTKLEEDSPAQQSEVNDFDNVPMRPPEALVGKEPPVRVGMMCGQHPNVQAVHQCRKCGGFMCATCDFSFPGDLHFCPTCVSRGDQGLSGKRKKMMIWSLVLAAWSTVGMSCLLSGAMSGMARSKEERTLLGWILIIFVLGPSITGLSLGMTAKRKASSNPQSLWIAIIWNAVLVASFVLLTMIGLSRH